jgi:hypothetical protein
MSEIRFQTNINEVMSRLTRTSGVIDKNIEAAFRAFVRRMYEKVLENISEMFSEEGRSRSFGGGLIEASGNIRYGGPLADSILATVEREGDLLVGTVSADIEHAPYARILEVGGVISAHTILPRAADALAIPVSTLGEWEEPGGHATGDFLVLFGVHHPGAQIRAYYYLHKALIDMALEFHNDIEGAIAAALEGHS